MKAMILAALTISSTVFAAQAPKTIETYEVVNQLSSTKVAPCLAKLHALQKKYEVRAGGDVQRVDVNEKKYNMVYNYDVIEGGDMGVGTATITVTTEMGEQFGFPGSSIPYITSCSFQKQIFADVQEF